MSKLAAAVDDLARRQKIVAHCEGGEATITIHGEPIFVTEDEEFDRTVFWATLARNTGADSFFASLASIAFNERLAADSSLTLGVSPDADCAILGRSVEIDDLDPIRVLQEAERFHDDFRKAKDFYETTLSELRQEHSSNQAAAVDEEEAYIIL